jgi:hypothetical protein
VGDQGNFPFSLAFATIIAYLIVQRSIPDAECPCWPA